MLTPVYLDPTDEGARALFRRGIGHRTAALDDSRLLTIVELPLP